MSNTKMKKVQVIKVCREPKPHEIARAIKKVSSENHFGPWMGDDTNSDIAPSESKKIDYAAIGETALQIGSKVSSKSRVSKKDFYAYRDRVYKLLKDQGKDFNGLPGKPFSKFSHGAIHDSPVKNYKNELEDFKLTVKQYYPEVYAQIENYTTNAERKQNADYAIDSGAVDEILKGVTADYINALKQKKASGKTLTKAEQKILDAYEYLNEKIRDGAKKEIQSDIGQWIMDNWVLILILLLLGFMVVKTLTKK